MLEKVTVKIINYANYTIFTVKTFHLFQIFEIHVQERKFKSKTAVAAHNTLLEA